MRYLLKGTSVNLRIITRSHGAKGRRLEVIRIRYTSISCFFLIVSLDKIISHILYLYDSTLKLCERLMILIWKTTRVVPIQLIVFIFADSKPLRRVAYQSAIILKLPIIKTNIINAVNVFKTFEVVKLTTIRKKTSISLLLTLMWLCRFE